MMDQSDGLKWPSKNDLHDKRLSGSRVQARSVIDFTEKVERMRLRIQGVDSTARGQFGPMPLLSPIQSVHKNSSTS